MSKRKPSTPSIAAEPVATYGGKAVRTWRFKRLSEEDLLEQARKPMSMPALKRRVQENPFAEVAYASLLQTSVAGLRALMRSSKALVPAQSELVLLYEQTMARGVEVFGNEEKFQRWLELRIPALGHKRPKELMTTFTGIRLVADEMETIAHGVFA
jgi:putative toxin-antitoxin system antitoxin component (TIGR02293 family)